MKKILSAIAIIALFGGIATPARIADAAVPNIGLVKSSTNAAVYYKAANGKRYVFPNEKIYFTWYSDFSSVTTITASELAAMPMGGNITYRPGIKLIKVTSDPKVYAIQGPNTLRWVASESAARGLYGTSWAAKVDDLSDAFFTNYEVGTPITGVDQFSSQTAQNAYPNLSYLVTPETPSGGSISSASLPKIGKCAVFPSDNAWNTDISNYPVHSNSANFIATIGLNGHLHPDFGTEWNDTPIGIPYRVVNGATKLPINFTSYGSESDPGPYPVPTDTEIEGGSSSDGDRHVLVVDEADCKLYEMYRAFPSGNGWNAGSGAVWDLTTNATRPTYWTSADAAGLPILPGLVRYDEVVEKGEINHAVRFTVSRTQKGFIAPATHYASNSTDANRAPMGLRLRMKASFDCTGLSNEAQVLCRALKKYGMIVADNGADWFITGAHDDRWNDESLGDIKTIPGSAFEVVDTGAIVK